MNKNDFIATLGSIASVLALFGILWIMGNYPLFVVFTCVGILILGLFRAIKGTIKDHLDEQDKTNRGSKWDL